MLEFLFEAILAPIFGELFNWLLFTPIGILYMFIRYRGSARRQQVLAQQYENEYANVGHVVVLNTVVVVMILGLLGLVVVAPLLHWLNK
ncbi:hypothetical protein [Hymenobacter sp. 102]|uniref:hypothetical protein n=1 Tax=Hymenobacter sp. 102 TaxID=3403152 RepID=UPI003CE9502B